MSQFSSTDATWMAQALNLARRGQYTTTPNPNVGCVIVGVDGQLVGQGWHQKAGGPHAEVHALTEAGAKAKNATAYVTLEPCSHSGRTPPCAEALIKSGVRRLVAAMVDPNPQVAGRGLQRLADAGIEVASGLLEEQAQALNPGFIKRMCQGRPWVRLKLAASLDGKTALQNGRSQWITGPLARQDVQRQRARACAILSGSGTVLTDDPSLNVRFSELGHDIGVAKDQLRQPLRVLLDGCNRLPATLKMFNLPGDTLVINQSQVSLPAHVQQWQAPGKKGRLDLSAVMTRLGQMQINELWVESGAGLAGALLREKLLDELILYQAPKLIGDAGRGLFAMPALEHLSLAYNLRWTDVRQVGEDLKISAQVLYA